MIERAALGLLLSCAISVAGWRARALSGGGALAAVGVGTAVITGTSWPGALVLGTFFVTSSVLSRPRPADDIAAKGGRRDAAQVLSNGGVAAVAALSAVVARESLAFTATAGALAAAAADTWATEIGSRSRQPPRLIVSRRVVARGTSGGVTRGGSIGAAAGATTIGCVAALAAALADLPVEAVSLAGIVALAGLAGAFADSVLGEVVQERRYCPACGEPTEATVHRCGAPTIHTGGVLHIDNDVVNLSCTLVGAATVLLTTL